MQTFSFFLHQQIHSQTHLKKLISSLISFFLCVWLMNLFWNPSPPNRNYIPSLQNSGSNKGRKWCENTSHQLPSEFILVLQTCSPLASRSAPPRRMLLWKQKELEHIYVVSLTIWHEAKQSLPIVHRLWSSWSEPSLILSVRTSLAGLTFLLDLLTQM